GHSIVPRFRVSDSRCPSDFALLRESSQCFTVDPHGLPIIEKNRSEPPVEIDRQLIPGMHLPAQRAASFALRHRRNFSNYRLSNPFIRGIAGAHKHLREIALDPERCCRLESRWRTLPQRDSSRQLKYETGGELRIRHALAWLQSSVTSSRSFSNVANSKII